MLHVLDNPQARHSDGTLCLEGATSLPPAFHPCCDVFAAHTATWGHGLRYEWRPKSRQWVIAIAESAGGGGIMITYCPYCGTPLLEEQERYWGDDPPQFNEITFTSNREGLRWLTGQILRIADAEPGSHTRR